MTHDSESTENVAIPSLWVRPILTGRHAPPASKYDILVASCGYEQRSRYLAERLQHSTGKIFAYSFESNRDLAYDANRAFYESVGEVVDEPETAFRKDLANKVEAVAAIKTMLIPAERSEAEAVAAPISIAVDISSMTRERIAHTVSALTLDVTHSLEIDFLYAVAQFSELVGSEGVVRVNRPIEGFEGWALNPSLPTVCIIGAGFEGDLALGLLEELEPAETFLFLPTGEDESYDTILLDRNRDLLSSPDTHAIEYEVSQPHEALTYLESLVHRLVGEYRVVILPLGPKIFSLSALLVGLVYPLDVAVWRLSADDGRDPQDRRASGHVVGLRVTVLAQA